jgi:hypothetical protein
VRSQIAAIVGLLGGVLVTGCSLVYPRAGLQHYLDHSAGTDAILCGAFARRPMEAHTLTVEEAQATSSCMTDAFRGKRRAYFYVQGPGIDSQLAWGMLTRGGHVMRFEYDSAPCGGPACNERFVVRDCTDPGQGEPVTQDLSCVRPRDVS